MQEEEFERFKTKRVIKKPSVIPTQSAKVQPAAIESQMLENVAKKKRKEEMLASIMRGDQGAFHSVNEIHFEEFLKKVRLPQKIDQIGQ